MLPVCILFVVSCVTSGAFSPVARKVPVRVIIQDPEDRPAVITTGNPFEFEDEEELEGFEFPPIASGIRDGARTALDSLTDLLDALPASPPNFLNDFESFRSYTHSLASPYELDHEEAITTAPLTTFEPNDNLPKLNKRKLRSGGFTDEVPRLAGNLKRQATPEFPGNRENASSLKSTGSSKKGRFMTSEQILNSRETLVFEFGNVEPLNERKRKASRLVDTF